MRDRSSLKNQLLAEIAASGPIGFDKFMAAALYDLSYGYYMGGGQPENDFQTAVETHPLFAAMLVRRLDRAWREFGCPDRFSVVELGSGRGTLAGHVIRIGGGMPWGQALEWVGVEISPARRRQAQITHPAVRFVGAMEEASRRPCRVVVANEFLDALPFRLARRAGNDWIEVRVGVGPDQELAFVDCPSDPALTRYARRWASAIPEGGMIEFRPGLSMAFRQIGELSDQALVILIDYGGSAAQVHSQRLGSGTALAYRGMKVVTDLLCEPGRQDLTAHVNFDEVIEIAQSLGFTAGPLRTQAEYLIDLGIGNYLPALQKKSGLTRERYEAEREAVMRLLDPTQMGSFKVLELCTAKTGSITPIPGL